MVKIFHHFYKGKLPWMTKPFKSLLLKEGSAPRRANFFSLTTSPPLKIEIETKSELLSMKVAIPFKASKYFEFLWFEACLHSNSPRQVGDNRQYRTETIEDRSLYGFKYLFFSAPNKNG